MTHVLFADASFSFNWNTAFNALMAIGTIGLFILARKKQSIEVTPGFVPVSKKDFEEHAKRNADEHDKLFSKIGGVERGAAARLEEQLKSMRTESVADRSLMHEKINQARESVASLDMANQIQNQQLAALQTDIKTILSRLPRPGSG